MFPKYSFYNGSIWELGYCTYFGNGYMKLTSNLRRHPKKTFMAQIQMLKLLQSDKAKVAINPKPKDEIIEDISYNEYIKNKAQ